MEYFVTQTEQFEKDLRFYVKKRKCINLLKDIKDLKSKLQKGNLIGDEISNISLPEEESTYKLRMADNTHSIGTRGGFRLIYYVIKNDKYIYLLTIYSKKDKSSISTQEIIKLIKKYC